MKHLGLKPNRKHFLIAVRYLSLEVNRSEPHPVLYRISRFCLPILTRKRAFKIGDKLSRKGHPRRGMPFLARAAARGHPEAQFRIAQFYLYGNTVPLSREEAIRWYRTSAAAQYAPAQTAMAELLWTMDFKLPADESTTAGAQEALRMAAQAAESGSPEGQAILGRLLCFGPEALRDEDRGEVYLRQAAQAGRPDASHALAILLHRKPDQTTDSAKEVRDLFDHAAAHDIAHAIFLVGLLKEQDGNPDEAIPFYRKAAERGHVPGQARWGRHLVEHPEAARGTGTGDGESWIRKAALAGDAGSAVWLGDYYTRPGFPANEMEASGWYRRAAENGSIEAVGKLGQLLASDGPAYNPWEAATWLQKAALTGSEQALRDLHGLAAAHEALRSELETTITKIVEMANGGDMAAALRLGLYFLSKDDMRCLEWLSKAAETYPIAQYWYGRTLERLATNDEMRAAARGWIARAADAGSIEAKAALGEMLLHGRGGPRDLIAALKLFEEIAGYGHLGGMYAVGVLLAGVEGVPPDLERSRLNLVAAAGRGYAPAQKQLEIYRAENKYGGLS